MDHGNGCPPVSLTGYSPVSQPEADRSFSMVVFFKIRGDLFEGFAIAHPIKLAGIDHAALSHIGFGHGRPLQI